MSEHSNLHQYGRITPKTKAFLMVNFCNNKHVFQANIEKKPQEIIILKRDDILRFKSELDVWMTEKELFKKIQFDHIIRIFMMRNRRDKSYILNAEGPIDFIIDNIHDIIYSNIERVEFRS